MSPEEARVTELKYKEAVSQCRIPEAEEDDILRYKEQLIQATAC